MNTPYLVVVDTAQIQPYVFGSNRLRENIGASYLVAQATGAWAEALLRNPIWKVYAGGGNFVALMPSASDAEEFTRRLSRRVLECAPGLRLVIAARPFEADKERLADALRRAAEDLAVHKRREPLPSPLLGLSVTQPCGATGLPATGITPRRGRDPSSVYPASEEILAKIDAAGPAQKRLKEDLPPSPGYDYPSNFDDLGRSAGENSYIAVVHADGNGMGRRLSALAQQAPNNDVCKLMLDGFAAELNRASLAALRATVARLEKAYGQAEGILAQIPLRESEQHGIFLLPMRPLVFGGDDVTFVCDGRLGLALATCYLEAFHRETQNLLGGPATACAGVAIVKTHYPFARAYELSDALCRSAKGLCRNLQTRHNREMACVDWHFTSGGLLGELDDIRHREYDVSSGRMSLRPVTLDNDVRSPRRWDVVRKGLDAFSGTGWLERRSKAKALREALRGGAASVRSFRAFYNATDAETEGLLPEVDPQSPEVRRDGWVTVDGEERCAYFDALELLDHFIPLDDIPEDAR